MERPTEPQTIHIKWNASDAWRYFNNAGIDNIDTVDPTVEQTTEVLAGQIGKLFRLVGWDGDGNEVVLSITSHTEGVLGVRNHAEPPYEGNYAVAEEPPPHTTSPHGDFLLDLRLVAGATRKATQNP